MKEAVIYARYSSDKQTEQSIDGQLRVCYDYAKANDIHIVSEYIDRAKTEKYDDRPEFQRMISDAKTIILITYSCTSLIGFQGIVMTVQYTNTNSKNME